MSALTFDHHGTRFASGGFDYVVNMFEFQKMDLSLRPSRELTPSERFVIFPDLVASYAAFIFYFSNEGLLYMWTSLLHAVDRSSKRFHLEEVSEVITIVLKDDEPALAIHRFSMINHVCLNGTP